MALYIFLAFFLFMIGTLGSLCNSHCVVRFLLATEVVLLASMIMFIAADAEKLSSKGAVCCIFVIILAAVELSVGLKLFACSTKDGAES